LAKDAKLKSLFVTPALALSALAFVVSIGMLAIASGYRELWLGAALAALPLPLVIGRLKLRPVARTSEYLPLHMLLLLVGLVLAGQGMYGNFVTSWELYRDIAGAILSALNPSATNTPGLVAIACAGLFLLYVFWYSRFGRFNDARLDVGGKLPEFEVEDLEGNRLQSIELLGAPAVFLFYRGNWCPVCMTQIDELVERYEEMQRLGIRVWLVSSQPRESTRALAEKHGVDFRFLIDRDNRAAELLGIAISNGVPAGVAGDHPPDTAMPTVFVTSPGGTIVFSDQTDNYRVRPEPDIFLAILRRAGVVSQ
jgi:peroxiredoxin